jgi:hypothetical protein
MGLLGQNADVPSVVFSLALAAALLSIAGLVAARWSRTRLTGVSLGAPLVASGAPS